MATATLSPQRPASPKVYPVGGETGGRPSFDYANPNKQLQVLLASLTARQQLPQAAYPADHGQQAGSEPKAWSPQLLQLQLRGLPAG